MLRHIGLLSFALSVCSFNLEAQTQANLPATDGTQEVRVIVASAEHSSDTVIAIPPDTSWTGSVAFRTSDSVANPSAGDLAKWLQNQLALNGLQSLDHPWHIVIEYDQFDEDGDNIHSGVVE
jgi:hypothetical protein